MTSSRVTGPDCAELRMPSLTHSELMCVFCMHFCIEKATRRVKAQVGDSIQRVPSSGGGDGSSHVFMSSVGILFLQQAMYIPHAPSSLQTGSGSGAYGPPDSSVRKALCLYTRIIPRGLPVLDVGQTVGLLSHVTQ